MPPRKVGPTVAQLRADAKKAGHTGYSKLTKPQLIALLKSSPPKPPLKAKPGKAKVGKAKVGKAKVGKAKVGKAKVGKASPPRGVGAPDWKWHSEGYLEALSLYGPGQWLGFGSKLSAAIEEKFQAWMRGKGNPSGVEVLLVGSGKVPFSVSFDQDGHTIQSSVYSPLSPEGKGYRVPIRRN